MRKPQNPRRPRGRNSGGRQQGNGRQRRPHNNSANRVFDSQGPDGRVKGTPAQLYERYSNASREVRGSDRILAESFLQFADHYYRLAAEAQDYQQENRAQARPVSDEQPQFDDSARTDEANGSAAAETTRSGERAAQTRRDEGETGKRGGNEDREDRSADRAPDRVTEDDIPMLRRRARPTRKPADANGVQPSLIDIDDTAQQGPAHQRSAQEASNAEESEKPAPRRRGRPRKTEAASGEDGDAAPRKRGRPRKSEASESDVEASDTEGQDKPAPKRRGRPRKNPAPASEPETVS